MMRIYNMNRNVRPYATGGHGEDQTNRRVLLIHASAVHSVNYRAAKGCGRIRVLLRQLGANASALANAQLKCHG